jgi:multimeric flavodoxin WrbA
MIDLVTRVVAINGSPRLGKGYTALLLAPFMEGMKEAGAAVDLFYADQLEINPCSCGVMHCWDSDPGRCCFQDDMEKIYTALKPAHILVLATPVYIPLPGQMQNVVNRLCPIINPVLETHGRRTRASLREDYKLRQMVLLATSGWWEIENFATVVRIAEELAADAGIEYAGAVLRPHAQAMKEKRVLTQDGAAVLSSAQQAGYELIKDGRMSPETLASISKPLVSREDYQ